MNKQNYTSFKLSKLLNENGCNLASVYWYDEINNISTNNRARANHKNYIPAYDILNDICVKYAKQFFGDDEVDLDVDDLEYSPITRNILTFLQQNKKAEAEEYIWKNCLFNPKNK